MTTFFLSLCLIGGVTQTHAGWAAMPFGKAPKVSGHSVGSSSLDDSVFLFGGLTGSAGSPCTDQTWEFGADNNWSMVDTKKKPRVRMYAASAVLGNKLVVFGGWDPGAPGSGGEFLDDVWEFDFSEKEWSPLSDSPASSTCKLPYPVSRHSACAMGDSTIVIHTHKGVLVFENNNNKGSATISEQPTSGDVPEGFSMCATARLSDTEMLLFGGSTRTQQMSRDAYVLDTTTWTWTKLVVPEEGEDRPPALASACAARVGSNEVLVFGGASIKTTGYDGGMGLVPQNDTWRLKAAKGRAHWTKIESTNKPDGRVAGSLSPLGTSSFLLQGGFCPLTKTTFDKPWKLTL